jgi:hypothetical protein
MKHLFAVLLLVLLPAMLSAQKAVIPNWKPGDSWIVSSEALIPSDDKKVDEALNVLVDTMRTSYRWKVEEETETGYILSLQLLSYSEIKRVSDAEAEDLLSLLSALSNHEPLRYHATKEARVLKEAPEEGSAKGLFSFGQKQVVILNDSIIKLFVQKWLVESPPAAKPYETVEADQSQEEEEETEGWEDSEADKDFTVSIYVDVILQNFQKKIETLHMPFGTEIKKMGEEYSATDLSESELEQLGISAEMIEMFKIEGTYLFNDLGEELEFTSSMSLDMQDMLSMFANAFEEAFSEKEDSSGKKKRKKDQSHEPKPKASASIPSMVINMEMNWQLDKATLVPTRHQMRSQSTIEEQGVSVNIVATENTVYSPE